IFLSSPFFGFSSHSFFLRRENFEVRKQLALSVFLSIYIVLSHIHFGSVSWWVSLFLLGGESGDL
ncbi:unnamed protein product, partial [Linum tenue]